MPTKNEDPNEVVALPVIYGSVGLIAFESTVIPFDTLPTANVLFDPNILTAVGVP